MKVSLVIPVAPYREAEIIESVKRLDYPKDQIQVIVVRGKNPSNNRNRGAERALGEIIGFLDDDGIIGEDFLRNVVGFFEKYPEVDVVGGPQLTPKDDEGFAKISGYALCSKFGAAGVTSRYKRGKLNLNADEKLLTSANLFVKKEVMGGVKFDSSLWPGEDPKFIEDCKKVGFKVAYSPDFVIYHRRRPDVKDFIKQIFNYGRVRPAKESFFKILKKPQFLVPSLFVVYLIALFGVMGMNASLTGDVIGTGQANDLFTLFFIPLVFYILLTLSFSLIESIKNKDLESFFILPFIYPMIHISYGIGMLISFFKKPKDRRLI